MNQCQFGLVDGLAPGGCFVHANPTHLVMSTIRHPFLDGDGRGKRPSSSGRGEIEQVGEDNETIDVDVV